VPGGSSVCPPLVGVPALAAARAVPNAEASAPSGAARPPERRGPGPHRPAASWEGRRVRSSTTRGHAGRYPPLTRTSLPAASITATPPPSPAPPSPAPHLRPPIPTACITRAALSAVSPAAPLNPAQPHRRPLSLPTATAPNLPAVTMGTCTATDHPAVRYQRPQLLSHLTRTVLPSSCAAGRLTGVDSLGALLKWRCRAVALTRNARRRRGASSASRRRCIQFARRPHRLNPSVSWPRRFHAVPRLAASAGRRGKRGLWAPCNVPASASWPRASTGGRRPPRRIVVRRRLERFDHGLGRRF
jgi:hypothetical protein